MSMWTPDPPFVNGPAGGTPWTADAANHVGGQYAAATAYTDAQTAAAGLVLPAGSTYAQIQAACTSAATFGFRVTAAGTITTSSTLLITSSCDLSGLTINYTGSGVAVQVGSGSGSLVLFKTIELPSVVNTVKTITGWSQVAGSVGVRVVNAFACSITVPRVRNFETSLEVRGEGTGNVYNTYTLGSVNNGKFGVAFTADSTGWANQNTLVGGAITMDSAEGTGVSGTRAVMLNTSTHLPNTNTFVGTSFEGDGWEYQIECYGLNNVFVNCRFETTSSAKVYWRASATRNAILQGYGTITPTYEAGAVRNSIERTGDRRALTVSGTSGVFVLQNDTSAANQSLAVLDPAFSVEAGNDPATAYSWSLAATILHGKRGGDANDRVQLDAQNGRLFFANGTAAPSYYLGNFGTNGLGISGGHLSWVQDNTWDLGLAGQRPKNVRAGTAVIVGSASIFSGTGSPETVVTAGVGSLFLRTDGGAGTSLYVKESGAGNTGWIGK